MPRRVRHASHSARAPRSAGLALAVLAGLACAASVTAIARADMVVKRPGTGFTAQVAESLVHALQAGPEGATLRVVDLTGDWNTDTARVARGSEGQATVFAIGPDATVAAARGRKTNLIAVAVPNPARLGTAATFVSMYPRLERVFKFLAKGLGAHKAGFVYTQSQNAETEVLFAEAAQRQGLTLVPIAVGSPGELVRGLKETLPVVDALLLPVDPILFDRESLGLIVAEAARAKRPTVGFLDALPALGVTACLVTSPAATASAALEAARTPGSARSIEADNPVLVVSRRAALAIGLVPEAMGAQRIE